MTALNMWEDGRNAYILNDTANFAPGSPAISRMVPKSMIIPKFSLGGQAAMTCSGCLHPEFLAEGVNSLHALQPRDLLAGLPMLMARWAHILRQNGMYLDDMGFQIALAIIDPISQRPALFTACDDAQMMPPDYKPGSIIQVRYWTTGMEAYGPFDYSGQKPNLRRFDPRRDGLAMMEAQRAEPWLGAYRIGGAAILTTIGADGPRSDILHTWPDEVGEPIRAVT